MARILVAKVGFSCEIDGQLVIITRGMTVREGHPVLESREDYFEPLVVDLKHVKTTAPAPRTLTRKAG